MLENEKEEMRLECIRVAYTILGRRSDMNTVIEEAEKIFDWISKNNSDYPKEGER